MDPYIRENSPDLSPRQREAIKRLQSAEGVDEVHKAFKELEQCFENKDLGMSCMTVGEKLFQAKEDPEKVVSFASRALKIMISSDQYGTVGTSMCILWTLKLLGRACLNLNRFVESLSYLNWAERLLINLEGDVGYSYNSVLEISRTIQSLLCQVKNAMGKSEDSVLHLRKACELVEKISGKNTKELAYANVQARNFCIAILKFEEAMHYCMKALEIYTTILGDDSEKVTECRKQLSIIQEKLNAEADTDTEISESLTKALNVRKDVGAAPGNDPQAGTSGMKKAGPKRK